MLSHVKIHQNGELLLLLDLLLHTDDHYFCRPFWERGNVLGIIASELLEKIVVNCPSLEVFTEGKACAVGTVQGRRQLWKWWKVIRQAKVMLAVGHISMVWVPDDTQGLLLVDLS